MPWPQESEPRLRRAAIPYTCAPSDPLRKETPVNSPRAVVRNWRDSECYLGHDNAIVWPILNRGGGGKPSPFQCLTHLSGLAGHSLQGGKSTNYHSHPADEQYYYILSGQAEVLVGKERHAVSEGSVAYFPPGVKHQLLGETNPDWMQYLIITCPVPDDRRGSEPRVLNWRDAQPNMGVHGNAVTWQLLERLDAEEPATDQPCLLAFWYLARQAVARGKASDFHVHDDKEQVYYILEGEGTVVAGFDAHPVREGDTVYLPIGVPHAILNDRHDGWLSYLVIS